MNSKKIFISIFIILAIVLMVANVFAYTTKGPIPNLANTNKGNIFNLKINEITYTKYSEPQKIENRGDKLYCGHIDLKTSAVTGDSRNLALSILISRPFTDKSIYPRYIEEIYLSGYEGKNQFLSRENKKLWMYSPSSTGTEHKIYFYEEELCSAETLDVYIFKPYYPLKSKIVKTGFWTAVTLTNPIVGSFGHIYNFTSNSVFEDYQEKVYVHHYKRALLNQGYVVSAFDLKKQASKLYNINNTENSSDGDAYFYNVDYAYGVRPIIQTQESRDSDNRGRDSSIGQVASPNTAGIVCDDSFKTATELGYQVSWTYKCADDKTGYYKCENGTAHGPYPFSTGSRLKSLICVDSSTTDATTRKCPKEYIYSAYDPIWFVIKNKVKNIGDNKVYFKCIDDETYSRCNEKTGDINIIKFSDLKFETLVLEYAKLYLHIVSTIPTDIKVEINEAMIDRFKNDICPDTNKNKTSTVLNIENNSNLSDINFSLNNTNWYIVNKIDNPESYILGNKTQDKNLSINLDSFNEGPIYAIISTANKKTEIETELKQIYQTGAFTNYVRQTGTNQFKIDATFTGFSKLEYSLDNNSKNLKINIKRENTLENIVLIFMQKSTDKVNLVYTNLYSLDNKSQSLFNYCMVNRNIVNFYCKGHNCSSNASCLSSGRWDFDPKIFEGLTPRAVEPTAPVVPIAPVITQQPTPPVENVTLQKGADGCYTSNPTTLAKIRQENGIGITKQQFSGKRTMSSIVLPTTNTGTDDDPSLTIAQIRTAFNRSGTNIPQKVKDASPAFYNLGLLYDIDPVFILAFFKAERSMFNQNSPSITQTMINNNDISGVSYCRCGGVDTGNYCSYPTLEQGIEATYLNLTRGTTYSPNLYRNKSFSAVSKSWNGKDSYVTSMTGYLADTYTWAGK